MSHHWVSDSLIYEYIGEVVQEREFLRRMQKYAQDGIRHFYFMMLQKDEVGIGLHRPNGFQLQPLRTVY